MRSLRNSLSIANLCDDVIWKLISYLTLPEICRFRVVNKRFKKIVFTRGIVYHPVIRYPSDIDRIFSIQSYLNRKSIMNLVFHNITMDALVITKMTEPQILKCDVFRNIEVLEAHGWELSFVYGPIYKSIVSKISSIFIHSQVEIEKLIDMAITKISFLYDGKLINPLGKKLVHIKDLTIKSYSNPTYLSAFPNATTFYFSSIGANNQVLKMIQNGTKITLVRCTGITDRGLGYLKNFQTVIIICCQNITDKGIKKLTACKRLIIYGCQYVTIGCVSSLPYCHVSFENPCHRDLISEIEF